MLSYSLSLQYYLITAVLHGNSNVLSAFQVWGQTRPQNGCFFLLDSFTLQRAAGALLESATRPGSLLEQPLQEQISCPQTGQIAWKFSKVIQEETGLQEHPSSRAREKESPITSTAEDLPEEQQQQKKKISKYLHEKRKRCRWKINLPGYIAPSRRSEKKGDCRDETPDSLCICTHPPANIHYINQNNGSSREDPHNPSSCTIIFPRGCMHVQRNEKNPHFSMRLLPAFSILLPLLQMCL